MAPAVKRMEKAHGLFFVVGGTGFYNGADEDFNESAADGVDADGKKQSGEGIRQKSRQNGKQDDSGCGKDMCHHHGGAVADLVYKFGGQQIDAQLNGKIEGDEHGDLRQRDPIGVLKREKQQGYKVVDHSLHNVPGEAGVNGLFVSVVQDKNLLKNRGESPEYLSRI